MVCVCPTILETKVIVAPNSPKERAKPNTIPANTPGNANGNVMVKNTRFGEAPNVLAVNSKCGSIFSNESRIERTTNGNATTAEANTAPLQLKANDKPNQSNR